MTNRSATHATFTIERTLSVPPEKAFAAWANPKLKARWFAAPADKSKELKREQDFRLGGTECLKAQWKDGHISAFEARYFDIIPDRRIIYTYDLYIDNKKISVSLATIEFEPVDNNGGTHLIVTEQGAFLDGYNDGGSREQGTKGLLDAFEASLRD